jgi:DNA-binding NarL/FixJ family response regulator
MQYPQILIHDDDGALARGLRPLAEGRDQRWVVREARRLDACVAVLRRGHPAVFVIKAGREVTREMTLVERLHALCPETPIVVVAGGASPVLAALAWTLGADYVFTADPSREQLVEVIQGLLERACESCRGKPASSEPPALSAFTPESLLPDDDADE